MPMPRARWLPAFATLLLATGLAACGGGDGRTVLTVYSPHGKDLLDDLEQKFEAADSTIDVQWVDMGSQEVLDRLRAEGANPQADVWFGAPADIFARAAKEGLLEPYTPSWASAVPAEARDAEGRWFGTYLTPEVIAYNTEAVSAADAPKDWDDVVDPKWRGQVVIRDPIASGSMRAIFGAQLLRSIRETGSPARGWEWLRGLDANTREYVLNPTILYQKLGRREGTITLFNMPDIATLRERLGLPIGYVIPRDGTPVLVDAIAVVKGTRHPDAARKYYEFVSSREAMLDAARNHLRIPARTDIPEGELPDWIRRARGEIRPMPLDAAILSDSLDVWMTYWDSYIRNSERRR
jgi:iron(III) transport system substrate-binding protein